MGVRETRGVVTLGLVGRRMRSVRLVGEALGSPEEVVRWFGAVQSQDFGPAKWALAQRMDGATDRAIDAAFDRGAILRTHALRPTWHFVAPDDIRWIQELTGPRVHQLNAYYYRQLELVPAILTRSRKVLVDALQGGAYQTRAELRERLAAEGIETPGFRMAYILMHAELDSVLCSGPRRGKQHTYALLDERVPAAPGLDRDDALAELARRYFTSHGPATVKDFRWWSSLTVSDIAKGLDGTDLEHQTVDGATYWFAPQDRPTPPAHKPTVHLLQGYDEYAVAFSESKHLIDVSGAVRGSTSGERSVFAGLVVLDGQLVGHWKRQVTSTEVRIGTELYRPMNAEHRAALGRAADRLGAFLRRPAILV